jgi:hypothetical protein
MMESSDCDNPTTSTVVAIGSGMDLEVEGVGMRLP